MANNDQADILRALQGAADSIASSAQSFNTVSEQLRNIERTLRGMSQTDAKETVFSKNGSFGSTYDSRTYYSGAGHKNIGAFRDEFVKTLFNDSANILNKGLKEAASKLGAETVEEIPGTVGQELAKAFKNKTSLGKFITGETSKISSAMSKEAISLAGNLKELGSGTLTFGKFMSEAGASLVNVGVAAAPLAAAMIALDAATNAVMPAFNGLKSLIEASSKVWNRYENSRQEYIKLAKQRLNDDINTIIQQPFEILKQAAQNVYDAWDANVRLINGTQGYDKAGLQSLMGAFAQRLRDEGLSDVLNTASITESLAKVLQAGLSGQIAEEFAYQATKLNAAIPTQDFFGYAASYSSIAANAVKEGKSQSEAIKEATASLYEFANNLVYASRELSGGFSTGLTNATSLYEQAVKISQAAGTGNINTISGVLTAVSGVIGAVAPDLANSITDAVYQAATGGNSSQLVALRSLAGTNASNTEFLRALANDPQKVFGNLFKNLASMYGDTTSGAFMERAEGYASLFGLSAEAFQRIDFNYLASAISEMNVNSDALNENIEHLQSGQTTQTAEQMKNAQINKYMIEEGLSYVLDNDAARSIQEHMWQEQISQQMMEAEYGVELRGAALEALSGIYQTIQNILNLMNPAAWMRKGAQLVGTATEASALAADIEQVLRLGNVGNSNVSALSNLITRGKDLSLTTNLVEMLGGTSLYYRQKSNRQSLDSILQTGGGLLGGSTTDRYLGVLNGWLNNILSTNNYNNPSSVYNWGSISKRQHSAVSRLLGQMPESPLVSQISGSVTQAQSYVASKIGKMLSEEYISDYVDKGLGYEDWRASAKNKGIADFDTALSEAGYTESDVKNYFQALETERGIAEKRQSDERLKQFHESGIAYWDTKFWEDYTNPLIDLLTTRFDLILEGQVAWMDYFKGVFARDWANHWNDYSSYYLKHEIYNGGTLALQTLEAVQKQEKSEKGDLTNALAEFLTQNNWNLEDFQDPQIQANALLAQILVVVNAIMNQTNSQIGQVSLADTLAALSTNMLNTTR